MQENNTKIILDENVVNMACAQEMKKNDQQNIKNAYHIDQNGKNIEETSNFGIDNHEKYVEETSNFGIGNHEKYVEETSYSGIANSEKCVENADKGNEIIKQQTGFEEDKQSIPNDAENTTIALENKTENDNKVSDANSEQNTDEIKQIYLGENWNDTVRGFVEKYPVAKGFMSDIGKELLNDQKLACEPLCLEIALNRVLSRAYVAPEDIINNQTFREQYVFANEEIQSKIVDNYLEGLEKSKPPKVITSRGKITLTPPDKPRSIEEAGRIITKMLQNRRI